MYNVLIIECSYYVHGTNTIIILEIRNTFMSLLMTRNLMRRCGSLQWHDAKLSLIKVRQLVWNLLRTHDGFISLSATTSWAWQTLFVESPKWGAPLYANTWASWLTVQDAYIMYGASRVRAGHSTYERACYSSSIKQPHLQHEVTCEIHCSCRRFQHRLDFHRSATSRTH